MKIIVSAVTVVFLMLVCNKTVFVESVLAQNKEVDDKKTKPSNEAAVNVVGKNGVLKIDGEKGLEIHFNTKSVEMTLSKFEKISPEKDIFNRRVDGLCFFISIKNISKEKISIRTSDKGSERSIFSAVQPFKGRLDCANMEGPFSINGFPYSSVSVLNSIAPGGEYKDSLVFYVINIDGGDVSVLVSLPSEKKPQEFYVVLKDLKIVSKEERSKSYLKFLNK